MAKASSGGHHPEVTSWGHLRPPGSLFAVVNLTCRSLPAKCHCWGHHSGYLRQHVSVSQDVHNLFSTQSFYRIFFFSNGFKFGTTLAFWSSQLHRENKKKKYKSDIFILLKLLTYHPEPNTPWEDFFLESCVPRAWFRTRLRTEQASEQGSGVSVPEFHASTDSAAPWDGAACPGSFFFFSSHTCHILSAKGEIKGRLSPKKRGRNVLIYPALELFIKARSAQQPTEPPSPFAFLTSIYILFITYSTLEPQSLGCGQNKCACRRSLSARLGLGYLSCRDSLRGYFWRLGKIVCFPLKQWAGSVWRGHGNFGSCLPLCIWRFSQN